MALEAAAGAGSCVCHRAGGTAHGAGSAVGGRRVGAGGDVVAQL